MRIGGIFGGKAINTSFTASVPPVEEPIAMIVSVVLIMAPEGASFVKRRLFRIWTLHA